MADQSLEGDQSCQSIDRKEQVSKMWPQINRVFILKIELPYNPAIPLLGTYLEKMKTLIQKDACTPMFIAVLFRIAKTWKCPKYLSTNEWIKKMHIYSAIEKNENKSKTKIK